MPPCYRVLTPTFVLFVTFAVQGRGRQLLEVDGVELRGVAQLVLSGGGTCNVLESDTSYEERKENHGAPMDVWRLDFSVHNGSGRWLDHLIALFDTDSTWPECTNWDVPEAGRFAQPIEWARSNGVIQESGRNVVAPGQTLTHTKFFIVLRADPEPRFENWSVDFDFAAAPPETPEPPVAEPRLSAEQDMVFWQSIMNSTNRADFEAYLKQFPEGVFRALAQNRLAALDAPASELPPADRLPAGYQRGEAGAEERVAATTRSGLGEPSEIPAPEVDTPCDYESGRRCFIRPVSDPTCGLWEGSFLLSLADNVAWIGECSAGFADGPGTLQWQRSFLDRVSYHEASGLIRKGRLEGLWTRRDSYGNVSEFHYVDGRAHGPASESMYGGERVEKGQYRNGYKEGLWTVDFTNDDGTSGGTLTGMYVNGRQHGRWVSRNADGSIWLITEYDEGEEVNRIEP